MNNNDESKSRKRKRHEETHKRNIMKEKVLRGEEYIPVLRMED